MSAIDYALSNIEFNIPKQILSKAFPERGTFDPRSLRERIRFSIIINKILPDTNIIHGETTLLPLESGEITRISDNELAVFYPDDVLGGREIMSVLSFTTSTGFYATGTNTSAGATIPNASSSQANTKDDCPGKNGMFHDTAMDSEVKKAMSMLKDVNSTVRDPYNTSAHLVGKNTVLLRFTRRVSQGSFKVELSNDPELNNVSQRSWIAFSELTLLATKAYIYKELIVRMGESQIYNGTELGPFTDYVQGLEGTNEEYVEYLKTVWSRVAHINDTQFYTKYIGSMINPLL